MGISWGLVASLWTGPTLILHTLAYSRDTALHLAPLSINTLSWCRQYRHSPHSMVPTSGHRGHRSSREGVVLCCLMLDPTGSLAGAAGWGCATTAWGAQPPFVLGPPFLFNSSWCWRVWSIRCLNSSLRGCWHSCQKCPVSLQFWQCPSLLLALSASCTAAL